MLHRCNRLRQPPESAAGRNGFVPSRPTQGYLFQTNDFSNSIRYLEESKIAFEEQHVEDQEYYQCCTQLGEVYLDYYLQDRASRLSYLRKARSIERLLSQNWHSLGKARGRAGKLKKKLISYGNY